MELEPKALANLAPGLTTVSPAISVGEFLKLKLSASKTVRIMPTSALPIPTGEPLVSPSSEIVEVTPFQPVSKWNPVWGLLVA